MKKFISCDWGTSAFRVRLIDSDHLEVVAEIATNDGIAGTFNRWTATQRPAEERLMFYMSYLQDQLTRLKQQSSTLIQDIPVIISGMASSSIGMIELPYKKLPFKVDGSDLAVQTFSDGKLIVVSGACTADDVMRGEETMLVGCMLGRTQPPQIMIFPGTHSKHVKVSDGVAVDFQTYMTGEFFDLLSNKSILANSVKKPLDDAEDFAAFDRGVKNGAAGNILHEVFSVRTNQVLRNLRSEENYSYLSGLLIGSELSEIANTKEEKVSLVCGARLKRQYMRALHLLLPADRIEFRDADLALVRGHQLICHHFVADL